MDVERRSVSEQPAGSVKREWVVVRYGVERPQFLSAAGTWGIISDAEWFSDEGSARAAVCPAGSTATAIRMELEPLVIERSRTADWTWREVLTASSPSPPDGHSDR